VPRGNPSSAVGDGRKTVTTAGTAVPLIAAGVGGNSTCITALSTNTGTICVGTSTVLAAAGTRRGTPLAPGESMTFNTDPALVWIDATVNGEGVSFSYEAR
jgi:hypothetical protein